MAPVCLEPMPACRVAVLKYQGVCLPRRRAMLLAIGPADACAAFSSASVTFHFFAHQCASQGFSMFTRERSFGPRSSRSSGVAGFLRCWQARTPHRNNITILSHRASPPERADNHPRRPLLCLGIDRRASSVREQPPEPADANERCRASAAAKHTDRSSGRGFHFSDKRRS